MPSIPCCFCCGRHFWLRQMHASRKSKIESFPQMLTTKRSSFLVVDQPWLRASSSSRSCWPLFPSPWWSMLVRTVSPVLNRKDSSSRRVLSPAMIWLPMNLDLRVWWVKKRSNLDVSRQIGLCRLANGLREKKETLVVIHVGLVQERPFSIHNGVPPCPWSVTIVSSPLCACRCLWWLWNIVVMGRYR